MQTILDTSLRAYQSSGTVLSANPSNTSHGAVQVGPAAHKRVIAARSSGADLAAEPVRLGTITGSAATQSLPDVLPRIRGRRLRFDMLKTVSGLLQGHRVSACQKVPSYAVQQSGASRGISMSAEGTAHFHGVGSCGDVWNCPVCASRIAASRRDEIVKAMRAHRKQQGACLLVTWTFPHYRTDKLSEILTRFLDGMRRVKSWRGYKKARDAIGYVGQIRALEVTHGNANGWHPHAHEVWFVESAPTQSDIAAFKSALFLEWSKACVKVGLPAPSEAHGIDVQFRAPDGDEDDAAGAYIAKWGGELTYAHMKSGKKGSRTPWAILADLTESYRYQDAQLFREYSEAFKGRAQLYWSRGLKDMFDIEEVSDEEMADRPESEIVRDLSPKEWAAIIKTDSRCLVLEFAEHRRDKLDELIRQLVDKVDGWTRDRSRMRRIIEERSLSRMEEIFRGDCIK